MISNTLHTRETLSWPQSWHIDSQWTEDWEGWRAINLACDDAIGVSGTWFLLTGRNLLVVLLMVWHPPSYLAFRHRNSSLSQTLTNNELKETTQELTLAPRHDYTHGKDNDIQKLKMLLTITQEKPDKLDYTLANANQCSPLIKNTHRNPKSLKSQNRHSATQVRQTTIFNTEKWSPTAKITLHFP